MSTHPDSKGIVVIYLLAVVALGFGLRWDRSWRTACAAGTALFGLILVLNRVWP